MKLIGAEISKVIKSRLTIFLMFMLFAVNLFSSWAYSRLAASSDVYDNTENYLSFCRNLEDNYNRITGISLFSSENGYAKNNMIKTWNVYKELPKIDIQTGYSAGIKAFMENPVTDIAMIIFVIYVVAILFISEHENGQNIVIKSTYKGRTPLGLAKLLSMLLMIFCFGTLLYGTAMLITNHMVSYGDLSRSIQSVAGYEGCSREFTIGITLLYFLIMKYFLFISLALVCAFIAVLSMDSVIYYISAFLLGGIEAVLTWLVSSFSKLRLLEQINIVRFIQTNKFFSEYETVNIFSKPISLYSIFWLVLWVIILITILGVMILYTKNVISDKRKLGKHFVKKKEKIINTVFGHELYKSWIMERNLFIVIIMILCLFFFIPKQNDYISSKEDAYYRMFIKEYSGEATADKLESIRGKLTELESLNAGEADDAELKYWDKTPDLDDSDSIRIALEEIEEYGNYLLQNGGSFMLDEGMALASGTGGNQEEKILFLISAFIVIFMTANVWSVEYDSGMNVLINISYAGGKKITNTKKLITAINIILVFVLINFSFYYSIFSAYGTHGILYPACSVRTMSQIPAFISILTYLIIKNIIKMFILCVTGALVLSISKRIKNYTGTLAATCVIFVVVIFICLFL